MFGRAFLEPIGKEVAALRHMLRQRGQAAIEDRLQYVIAERSKGAIPLGFAGLWHQRTVRGRPSPS